MAATAALSLEITTDEPVVILYDQEGRPGKWAFSEAPKAGLVSGFLSANTFALEGRTDVSLRLASTGVSGDVGTDCAAHETVVSLGRELTPDAIGRYAARLSADGHQTAPAAALRQAVADLTALGGGRVIYFADTLSSCEDDPLWVAETAPDTVRIDVVAMGAAEDLHELSELALASGGVFRLWSEPDGAAEPGGPMIDEALPVAESGDGDGLGAQPPRGQPLPVAKEGADVSIDAAALRPRNSGSDAVLAHVNTGIDQCPAFDALSRKLLDYTNGIVSDGPVIPDDPVAIAFVLDASGSMAGHQDGRSKMEIAKEALGEAVQALDGVNAVSSLHAYGFDGSLPKTQEASCPNTAEVVPFGPNNGWRIARVAEGLRPYGYTPLGASLRAAGERLQAAEASRRVAVLISDGEETCGGDPVAEAAALAEAGIGVNTYVVGYDLDLSQRRELEAVAVAGGTGYLDAEDGPGLKRVLKELVSVVAEKTERIAPSCSNPVRGGPTPETATLISPGIYTVGELLEPGEFRYYRVAMQEGHRAVIRGLIQSWQYVDTAEGPRESSAAPAALTIETRYPDGRPTAAQSAREVGIPGTPVEATFVDTTGGGMIFGLGDAYRRLPPESLLEVTIVPFGDGGNGDAGAVPDGEDVARVGSGGTAEGNFGYEDVKDVWHHEPEAPARLTASLAYREGAPKFRLTVYDAASGKRIGRGNNGPVQFDATGPVRIEVENRSPKLRPELGAYTIVVSDE
ncbi:vWA domain-containing protein [Leisingera methylohalidivorans]|uniref:vWA domain-containing protein n=1 Tax=Leisingera methylohalidivorans TaxID=133924 RepID=UPI0005C762B0|nr:vWA domain-containing protein [Leisingera methylohalidivorans]